MIGQESLNAQGIHFHELHHLPEAASSQFCQDLAGNAFNGMCWWHGLQLTIAMVPMHVVPGQRNNPELATLLGSIDADSARLLLFCFPELGSFLFVATAAGVAALAASASVAAAAAT